MAEHTTSESPSTDHIIKGARPNIETGREVLPLIPRNFDDVIRYARMFLVAKAIPDALTKNSSGGLLGDDEIIAKTFAVIAAGAEVGMGPVASTRWITVINNRTNIWGAGAVGCLHRSGRLENMIVETLGVSPNSDIPTEKYSHDYGYRVILKRKGMPTPFTGEFTVGMAIRAHLWMNSKKRPWIEHPDDQLYWRAFHRAAVRGFSDALNGMGIAEIADEEAEPDIKTDDSFLDDAPPPSNGQDPQNGSAVQPPPPSDNADSPRRPEESAPSPAPAAGAANNWYVDWWSMAERSQDWKYDIQVGGSHKTMRYDITQLIRVAPDINSLDRFINETADLPDLVTMRVEIMERYKERKAELSGDQ